MGQQFSVASDGLDQELEALRTLSVPLRRKANSLLPIFRLPTEILIFIFDECRREDFNCSRRLGRGRWPSCTYVCHHWRTVALTAPALWNHILITPGTNAERLEASLNGSRTTPLALAMKDIWIDDDLMIFYWIRESLLSRVARELSRTTALTMCMSCSSLQSMQWPESLPLLEQLSVTVRMGDIASFDGTMCEVFPRDIATCFPRLKSYRTHGAVFHSRHWILPQTLTELQVSTTEARITYTLHDILDALQHMPLLEFLSLKNAIPSSRTHAPWMRTVLPSLRRLHLSGALDPQIAFLDAIELDSSVRLRLHLLLHHNFDRAELLCGHSLPAYLAKTPLPQGATISVAGGAWFHRGSDGQTGRCHFSFTAWSRPQTLESMRQPVDSTRQWDVFEGDAPSASDVLFSVSFLVPEPTVALSPASTRNSLRPLERLLSTFPLSDVRTLALRCTYGPVFGAPWVYHKLTKLHTLSICGAKVEGDGLQGTLQQLDLAADAGDRTAVFPNLRLLALSRIRFHGAHESFLEMLESRRLLSPSGAPLPDNGRLLLHDCYSLTRSYVDKLSYVAAVEWDGLERDS